MSCEIPDGKDEGMCAAPSTSDVFQVADLYAKGLQEPVNLAQGNPMERGREVLIPIQGDDGAARVYGMHIPTNFDASKPTRLIIAAHGVSGNPDAANPVMENELDPEGHAQNNSAGDNVVYIHPIGENEIVHTILGQTPVQSWRTPGRNLLPDEGKSYRNDLHYVHSAIADAEQRIKEIGSSVYIKEAFGFSDGGRMVREYNCAYPGELSYVESDHGTSLGNDKQCAAETPTTIVESGPSFEFVPSSTEPTILMLPIRDRMLPPEGGVGAVSQAFATEGFKYSQPMRQVDEARAANQCIGDPQISYGDGQDGHGKNTVETTWQNCPGGYVKFVQEYLDPQQKWPSGHAVNDIHNGKGGMPVVGTRADNNEVAAFRKRADDIAKQKLLALMPNPDTDGSNSR